LRRWIGFKEVKPGFARGYEMVGSFFVLKWLSCMSLDPRITGANLAENDVFLRMTSFRREVKPSVTML
jgi:hypothetical protein